MSRSVVLERASLEDVPALAALEGACFSHPWTSAQFADEIAAGPPGAVLVLRALAADRSLAACALCAYRIVADELQLLDVAVAPTHRRLGLGRFLLALSLRRAWRQGARVAWLEVRASASGAQAFYQALGFVRQGLRRAYYREPVEDALLMRRELTAADGIAVDGLC